MYKYMVAIIAVFAIVATASVASAQCHFSEGVYRDGIESCRPMSPKEIITVDGLNCARALDTGGADLKSVITGEYRLGSQEFCKMDPDVGKIFCTLVELDCCCNFHNTGP